MGKVRCLGRPWRQRRQSSALPGRLASAAALILFSTFSLQAESPRVCLIITGLGGLPRYRENFEKWGAGVEKLFRTQADCRVLRVDGERERKARILELFNEIASSPPSGELWIFLIGHGNHDGRHYRFNIRGPDLTEKEIGSFLKRVSGPRVRLVAATSASGPLARSLAGPGRVILTATRSGSERQPPQLISFLLEAASRAEADRDKDGRVSLLEAYWYSRARIRSWYKEKGRIQTEHPLLVEDGVRLGEEKKQLDPAQWGTLLAATAYLSRPPEKSYRSLQARRLAQEKTQVEHAIEELKRHKKEYPASRYYQRLEELLLRLARINQKLTELEAQS